MKSRAFRVDSTGLPTPLDHGFRDRAKGIAVPANRSRTLEWRRCLRQVHERGGTLEIAVASPGHGGAPSHPDDLRHRPHLIWRVRLLGISEQQIIVEQPCALGHLIPINAGTELIVVLSIGQNRWMFASHNEGSTSILTPDRRMTPGLRLTLPAEVQRCQRRNHYRVDTATLNLPHADLWPLLDPGSVLIAERACEIQHEIDSGRVNEAPGGGAFDHDSVMPEVGPKFGGLLLNLGGGGVGIRIPASETQSLLRHKIFWLRIALASDLKTPICASAKVVHTHIESNHDLYAGLAFDFSFNPSHQKFVVDQICRYIALQQRAQTQQAAVEPRKIA